MFDELLRGPPGKNGKNGKDGRDGRPGRDAISTHPAGMEYLRINTRLQTFVHEAKVVLPNSVNDSFKVYGNTITFLKTDDYQIHFHVLGNHVEYSWDTVTCQIVRNNDGFLLDDGNNNSPVQNMSFGQKHFSKDESIYFQLMYVTPDTTDPIEGTVNIDIKRI